MTKVLLVDDERLARSELKRLLAAHPDMTVVGEARNADEAEARLHELSVDLLFLDIQMPGASGFDLLERLDHVPTVIFTTAFDEFAVRAFEVNAFDYLMKPVAPERLARALDRVRRTATRLSGAPGSEEGRASLSLDRVFIREGERCWIVRLQEIRLFESEGNYTRVYFGQNRPLILKSLQALESRLNPASFFRASRTHIINLRWVEAMETEVDGSYAVSLREGPRVAVSRRHSRRLRETLSL
jgi:two-component system LytT family response regulator